MITNPISGEVREVPDLETFLKDFDPSVHEAIRAKLMGPGVQGIMMFENLQMDSSQFGKRTAMIFGPSCTYKSAEEAAKGWLNDLPSQRQYPRTYFQIPPVATTGPIHEGFAGISPEELAPPHSIRKRKRVMKTLLILTVLCTAAVVQAGVCPTPPPCPIPAVPEPSTLAIGIIGGVFAVGATVKSYLRRK